MNTIKRTEKTITPRQAILRAAVEKYGSGAQQMKAIEELGELIRALARADDPENIAEEMADVEIMLAQLRIILGNDTDVERWKVKKLQRLNRRLHAAEMIGEEKEPRTSSAPDGAPSPKGKAFGKKVRE